MSIQNLNRKFAATFVVAAALGLTACAGHNAQKDDMMKDDMKSGEMMADDMKKDGEMMADDMKKDGEMMSDDDTMMDGDGK